MSQPNLNEKAATLIEELTVMADLHGGNGDTAAAEEFNEWVDVVRDLVAELDCPHRLARHSKRLVEKLRADIERLNADLYEAKEFHPIGEACLTNRDNLRASLGLKLGENLHEHVEALRKDAERYRWLRADCLGHEYGVVNSDMSESPTGDDLDEVIDAALGKGEQP